MDIQAKRKRQLGESPITLALIDGNALQADVARLPNVPTAARWLVLLYNQQNEQVVAARGHDTFQDAQDDWLAEDHDHGGDAKPLGVGRDPGNR